VKPLNITFDGDPGHPGRHGSRRLHGIAVVMNPETFLIAVSPPTTFKSSVFSPTDRAFGLTPAHPCQGREEIGGQHARLEASGMATQQGVSGTSYASEIPVAVLLRIPVSGPGQHNLISVHHSPKSLVVTAVGSAATVFDHETRGWWPWGAANATGWMSDYGQPAFCGPRLLESVGSSLTPTTSPASGSTAPTRETQSTSTQGSPSDAKKRPHSGKGSNGEGDDDGDGDDAGYSKHFMQDKRISGGGGQRVACMDCKAFPLEYLQGKLCSSGRGFINIGKLM
jgi:hypothetical protein